MFFSLKKKSDASAGVKPANSQTAAELRVMTDMKEFALPPSIQVEYPNPSDILNFNVSIRPPDGLYAGATFSFTCSVPLDYPYNPPKVQCTNTIYHPNIDLQGKVCLNILREEWKPVLNLNAVLIGLLFLFQEPNPDDPLNKDAAQLFIENKAQFVQNVNRSLRGATIGGVAFSRLI
eukprot:TRINITY_DN17421_c0_g1_i1.p1 TRINITY_DN17421_c0_g1~~TRINITY_DN17421_c0_g1_i1.p1  ORF type:complete len:177 (-),score=41.41 TRINITY_DN17421_c0_g1_i1:256-786(-)